MLRINSTNSYYDCPDSSSDSSVCITARFCATYTGKGVEEELQGKIKVNLDDKKPKNKRIFYENNGVSQTEFKFDMTLRKGKDLTNCGGDNCNCKDLIFHMKESFFKI